MERALNAAVRDGDRITDLLEALRTARLWIPLPSGTVTDGSAVVLLNSVGLDISDQQPPIIGSWLRHGWARTRTAIDADELTDQLAKIERALQMPTLLRPQAEIDGKTGWAVAQLIASLANETTAIIQAGSILLIKVDGRLVVRNLTQVELAHVERNPRLLSEPAEMLEALQQLTGTARTSGADRS